MKVLAQILAAFRWAKDWQNQHVVIYCDNETAVHIINKGSTADSTYNANIKAAILAFSGIQFQIIYGSPNQRQAKHSSRCSVTPS